MERRRCAILHRMLAVERMRFVEQNRMECTIHCIVRGGHNWVSENLNASLCFQALESRDQDRWIR